MKRRDLDALATSLGFPPGAWADAGDGLVARFDARDRLEWLAWRADGAWVGTRLELKPDEKRGVLRTPEGSGGTEDREVYAGGRWEVFDAWSDNQRPRRMLWSRWTRRAATRILGRPGCVLCGQPLSAQRAAVHLADGRAHLCGPCLARTGSQAPTPRQWPLGARTCGACGLDFADADPLFEGTGGKVCGPCVAGGRAVP